MKKPISVQQFVSLFFLGYCLTISHGAFSAGPKKILGINDYLLISCETVLTKESSDPFINKLKNKLISIHKASNLEKTPITKVCEDLGEAQFSRLMEDQYLFFEKK